MKDDGDDGRPETDVVADVQLPSSGHSLERVLARRRYQAQAETSWAVFRASSHLPKSKAKSYNKITFCFLEACS